MNLPSPRRMFVAAAGVLLVAASVNGATAQTQYPITPPVVVNSPTTVAPNIVVTPTIVSIVSGATATTAPASAGGSVAGATATNAGAAADPGAAPAVAPVAEVLGETLTANPAFTGSNATRPIALAGVALLGAGSIFVIASRRRRRTAA